MLSVIVFSWTGSEKIETQTAVETYVRHGGVVLAHALAQRAALFRVETCVLYQYVRPDAEPGLDPVVEPRRAVDAGANVALGLRF